MAALDIDLTVYPDECDAYGHLNQASFLALFERMGAPAKSFGDSTGVLKI